MTETPDRRHAMLVEGRRLFLEQGYTATSIDAICDAAAVTKGAFFHHFKSKDDFASQVLAFTWQPVLDAHETSDQADDAVGRLGWHIEFMARWICDTGRLMPSLAQELGSTHDAIRSQVGGYFATWMGYLESMLADAATETGSRVDIGPLKDFIVATTEGAPVVRSQFGQDAVDNAIRLLVTATTDSLTSTSS